MLPALPAMPRKLIDRESMDRAAAACALGGWGSNDGRADHPRALGARERVGVAPAAAVAEAEIGGGWGWMRRRRVWLGGDEHAWGHVTGD
uniref:Uncharacterized protein n=1 Tax=Arundo donax TaxID=35708 RepID=A0A0A8ZTM3_ARUDO